MKLSENVTAECHDVLIEADSWSHLSIMCNFSSIHLYMIVNVRGLETIVIYSVRYT